VTRTGERLVTVLVTLAVPAEATRRTPPAWSPTLRSAPLEVGSAAGVEAHLPVPGSLIVPRDGGQPWRVEAVSKKPQP